MFAVLRLNPQFRKLWYAQVISQAGDWLNRIAILSLIGSLGGAEAALKIGGLYSLELALRLLPAGAFGPFAGPAGDRLPRRAVMIVADLGRTAVVLGMLAVHDEGDLPLLYGLLLAQSSLAIFFNAARAGALPSTVRPEDLHTANTLSAATWSVMLALGTSIGGLLMLHFSLAGIFIIDAVTYIGSALFLAGLKLPPTPEQEQPFRWRDAWLLVELRRGWHHARGLGLGPVLFAKSFWGGAGGFLVMLPILASVRFASTAGNAGNGSGPLGSAALEEAGFATGMLYAARGVGTCLGPILGRLIIGSADLRLLQQIGGGFLVAAFGYALVPFCESLVLACACVTFAHLGGSAIWVASATYWQRHVANEFRSRVFAVELLGVTTMFSLGGYLAGQLYDASTNVDLVFWSTSATVLVCGVLWTLFARKMFRTVSSSI